MQARTISSLALGLAALLAAPLAAAHSGVHTGQGLVDGFMHPASGLDHLLVAIAAGYWAARTGDHGLQRILYVLSVYAGGLLLGVASLAWAQPDLLIWAGALIAAVVIAVAIAAPQLFGYTLFGGFAGYHGLAHMLGITSPAGVSGFGIGLFLSMSVLLLMGLILHAVVATHRAHTQR